MKDILKVRSLSLDGHLLGLLWTYLPQSEELGLLIIDQQNRKALIFGMLMANGKQCSEEWCAMIAITEEEKQ